MREVKNIVDGCFHDFLWYSVMDSTMILATNAATVSIARTAASAGPLTFPVVVKLWSKDMTREMGVEGLDYIPI